MELKPHTVKEIAATARLSLTDDEAQHFAQELKEILHAFSQLDNVATENIEPSFQPLPIPVTLRDDTITKGVDPEQALSLTSHKKDGYFKGPRIV